MTTHILRSDCAQGQLLTMKEASQVGNVSISTLRLWDSEGVLETRRTVGGHRRIVKGSLLSCLGVPDSGIGKIICIYLRVSSRKQESAGSLERQRERMLEWVKERFGLGENEILIIRDVASAFGSRTGLQKVVDGIIAGEISHVIAEHQDRLSRVGSELRLLEHLANQNGCELIYAKQTISDESDQSFMVRELIDFVTVICNRISSRKAAALARADVSDDVIERTQELLEEGYGLTSVIPKLQEEGFWVHRGFMSAGDCSVIRRVRIVSGGGL